MAQFKCKMCGGSLNIEEGQKICECEYCGSTQTVPDIIDNTKLVSLHNRANTLRLKNEFDKALLTYENIISENPKDAEAHWGILLCRYGIEYVDDPKTGKKIPTCHRTQQKSIFDDLDYKEAIDNSDVVSKNIYQEEATEIDRIQKSILAISNNEKPYDIFICYKESDEQNKRTKDSVIAQELYDELTKRSYKVFFARVTLESKLGSQYEPYIYAALNTSKVMLVIGTKPEYFNAIWVKNEWARFLSMMNDAKEKKYIIPCYRDMDAYELPEELTSFQAQDMSKLGFMHDLIRGISKLLGLDSKKESEGSSNNSSNATTDSLLKRARLFLNDRDYDNAKAYCNKVLDINPELCEAYEILLLAELKTTSEGLNNANLEINDIQIIGKIIKFGDSEKKAQYNKILVDYETRLKNSNLAEAEKEINAGKYDNAALWLQRCDVNNVKTYELSLLVEYRCSYANLEKGNNNIITSKSYKKIIEIGDQDTVEKYRKIALKYFENKYNTVKTYCSNINKYYNLCYMNKMHKIVDELKYTDFITKEPYYSELDSLFETINHRLTEAKKVLEMPKKSFNLPKTNYYDSMSAKDKMLATPGDLARYSKERDIEKITFYDDLLVMSKITSGWGSDVIENESCYVDENKVKRNQRDCYKYDLFVPFSTIRSITYNKKTNKLWIKTSINAPVGTDTIFIIQKGNSEAPSAVISYMNSIGLEVEMEKEVSKEKKKGCYVATCVYGSYDCPEVWTLRRYRDYKLNCSWYGRLFIKLYYAISPTIVKLFGNTKWFKNMWKSKLDRMVKKYKSLGYEDTPYDDLY